MSMRSDMASGQAGTHRRFLGFICWETGRDKRNMLRFGAMIVLWVFSSEVVAHIQMNVEVPMALAWMLAFVPALPSALAVLGYLKFLREADEMIRRIHLTGMAVGFGAGAFVSMGLHMPHPLGPPYKEMLFLMHLHKGLIYITMVLGWSFGQLAAARRFK